MRIDGERAAGVLLGLAAGDALGAPYEFAAPVRPEDAAPVGGGIADWAPGEWTDDTQMAVCIAEVTAAGSTSTAAIGGKFLRWYEGGPADVGNQTRAVLTGVVDGAELPARAAAHFAANPRNAAGNGSLMRTAPVALAALGDDAALLRLAREVSALTHGDPLAGDACALWCVAIDRAVREDRLDGIHDGLALLEDPDTRAQWAAWIAAAESDDPQSFRPNGFVVTALQAAHAAITQTPVPAARPERHFEDALRAAVAIGDDSDTVAAIAGGLLGARWGAAAIPADWLTILHGWPGLRAADLVELARRTVAAAASDRPGGDRG